MICYVWEEEKRRSQEEKEGSIVEKEEEDRQEDEVDEKADQSDGDPPPTTDSSAGSPTPPRSRPRQQSLHILLQTSTLPSQKARSLLCRSFKTTTTSTTLNPRKPIHLLLLQTLPSPSSHIATPAWPRALRFRALVAKVDRDFELSEEIWTPDMLAARDSGRRAGRRHVEQEKRKAERT